MPAIRNIRRSRRLSNQDPTEELDWFRLDESNEFVLQYILCPAPEPGAEPPTSDGLSLASTTPSIVLSPSPVHDHNFPSAALSSSPEPRSPIISRASRKRKDGHVPRPPNAFLIFRSDFWAKQKETGCVERDHRQISRIAAYCWRNLSEYERQIYHKRAEQLKLEHARNYPDYKYSPAFRKDKASKKKLKDAGVNDEARCEALARLLMRGLQGTELQSAAAKVDERLEKQALERTAAAARKISSKKVDDYHGDDDNESDDDYRESSRYIINKANPKPRRRSRRSLKKSVVPRPLADHKPAPVTKHVSPQAVSPAPQCSPFIPTSDIPPLELSAVKPEASEPQISSESPTAPDFKIKEEPCDPMLTSPQCQDPSPSLKEEFKDIKPDASPFVDVHTLSNFCGTSGYYSLPIPFHPSDGENHATDLYFDYGTSSCFETPDFSIFDGHIIESSKLLLPSKEVDEIDFSQWVNLD